MANQVWFELAPDSVVAAGATVTINLVADGQCDHFEIGGISDGSAGGSVSNLQVSDLMDLDLDFPGYIFNLIHENTGYLFAYMTVNADNAVEAGTPLLSFDYTVSSQWDGLTEITVTPLAHDDPYFYYWDGELCEDVAYPSIASVAGTGGIPIQGVTIVPEPATMALLGLGGLFLRRRRQA